MGDSNLLVTSYQLMNAISSSNVTELNNFIELGGDVNMTCKFSYGLLRSTEYSSTACGEAKFSGTFVGDSIFVPSLHQAVRVCYDKVNRSTHKNDAITVLERLLEGGADPSKRINSCYICNISGSSASFKSFPGGTALEFADFLLQHNINSAAYCTMMESVTKLLRGKMIQLNQPKASVLLSTKTLWNELLNDNDFYDISFKCSDGVVVHAHKLILAAASAYFRTMFLGLWKEMTENVIELKETPSATVKIILKFIYTGSFDIDSTKLDEEILLLFPLAYQYMITPLQEICEHHCLEKLDHAHIIEIMQLARLYSATKLLHSCFEYVKKHSAGLMVEPGFMILATADPELWSDLTTYITGTDTSNTSTTRSGTSYEESNSAP